MTDKSTANIYNITIPQIEPSPPATDETRAEFRRRMRGAQAEIAAICKKYGVCLLGPVEPEVHVFCIGPLFRNFRGVELDTVSDRSLDRLIAEAEPKPGE